MDTLTQSKATIKLRRRFPLVLLGLLLAGALLLPDRVWNTMLVGFGGLFIVAFLWVWTLSRGLQASRRLRFGWVAVGDRLSEELMLVNNSDVPALWVEISDRSNVPGYRLAVVRSAGARGTERWRQSAVCLQRGQFQLGPWAIRTSDPFGIFTMTRHYHATEEIIIHPPIHGDLPIPLPLGESSGRVRARQRSWQATINVASVRTYQPRDPFRWIHWPSSARHGELLVRQFDLDAAGDIWLLLDLHSGAQLASGADGTEEHSVLLAAALAARAESSHRAVGLAAYGRAPQILPPARGQAQQWRILRTLALIHADGETSLEQGLRDLSHIAQKGAAVIIITADYSESWLPELITLSNRAVHSNVILFDRPSFGGEGSSQAQSVAIQQLGFDTQIIRQGEVGQPLHEQNRRGFWEFIVTSTGKAIAIQQPTS